MRLIILCCLTSLAFFACTFDSSDRLYQEHCSNGVDDEIGRAHV